MQILYTNTRERAVAETDALHTKDTLRISIALPHDINVTVYAFVDAPDIPALLEHLHADHGERVVVILHGRHSSVSHGMRREHLIQWLTAIHASNASPVFPYSANDTFDPICHVYVACALYDGVVWSIFDDAHGETYISLSPVELAEELEDVYDAGALDQLRVVANRLHDGMIQTAVCDVETAPRGADVIAVAQDAYFNADFVD